jgi:hypothetical protein
MLICAAGDIHGAMDRLYHDVLAFEASLGIRFDYVLHVGDFGVTITQLTFEPSLPNRSNVRWTLTLIANPRLT